MVELLLLVPAPSVDRVSDALMELDAAAVTVEDADVDTPDEQPIFGEPGMPQTQTEKVTGWQRSVLKTLFEDEAAAQAACVGLLELDEVEDVHVQGIRPVEEQDWVRLTQSQFSPVPITSSFWIVPTWHEVPADAREVIRLDPGLAFGTGTHPTTRMCLRWIARQASERAANWNRVLDYGCGSGILAIAAAKFGARSIDAVDIDPAAVESSGRNASANGVALNCALPDGAQGLYPLVLANILSAPLKLLAPLLCGHVASGGDLVLAGILERQTDELRQAYAPWIELQVGDAEDGWVLLTGRKA
ncbi:MAG TPA: 50S ribosomal protein L11 methyltransferase [Burkholderiaceae bacterium]|nr:50S ribosomal protein L11 methyltransferase [Burkholderiaceae bacterium]HMY99307.1 50S ribosomal protein L11 methyltransferase [Burkholderiaceae bacterium]HNG81503.1 50S ribosomal protein L11 methyltransferase [Burkholderiaceae bacterium]